MAVNDDSGIIEFMVEVTCETIIFVIDIVIEIFKFFVLMIIWLIDAVLGWGPEGPDK